MDRKSFLKALKKTLWWRLPPEELSSVLEDYNEYFDSGMAEGKSEAELCKQFGRPAEIATDIVAERGSKYYSVALGSMSLCAVLLLIAIFVITRPSWLFQTMHADTILYVAIFGMSVLSILLASRTVGTAVSARSSRSMMVMHIVMDGLGLLSLWSVTFIIQGALTDNWFTPYISMVNPEILGPTLSFILTVLMILTILLWLITIYKSATLRRWQLIFIPLNAAALSLLICLINLLQSLSDPDSLMPAIYTTLKLAALQLLPILLLIPHKRRGK